MFCSPDIENLNQILEREAKKVIMWCNANKIIINVTKTNYMLFSNKRNIQNLRINLNNVELEQVNETSFLGVTF